LQIIISSGPLSGHAVDVDRELVIGRNLPADLLIDDPQVSGRHALIRPHGDVLQIEDVGSATGTSVDGERITGRRDLTSGDEVRVGDTTFRVVAAPLTGGDRTATHWTLSVRTGPDSGSERVLHEGSALIGRDVQTDLPLTDPGVSATHVRITVRGQVATVTDLDSANGTLVDGLPVGDEVAIRSGAEIQVGETVIVATRGDAIAGTPAPTVRGTARADDGAAPSPMVTRARVLVGVGAFVAVLAVAAVALNRGGGTLTTTEIVTKNRASTVRIFSRVDGRLQSTGSGFVIDADKGLIITNSHVATGGTLSVRSEAVRDRQAAATIIAANPCEDLALINVQDPALLTAIRAVTLAATPSVQGDPVLALGFAGSTTAGDDALSATSGIVSQPAARYDVPLSAVPLLTSVVQHTAAVTAGSFGGPLFDVRGELIGVNTATDGGDDPGTDSETSAISETRLREQLAVLTRGDAHYWLGLSLGETLRNAAGDPAGVAITGVTPGSPADGAGVRAGFALTAVDGQPVFDGQSYCAAVPAGEGREVTLTVRDTLTTGPQTDVRMIVGNG
jgi:S1-C subfamily serine protease